MKTEMQTKNVLVSFLAIAAVLFVLATVSASDIATNTGVTVNGIDASWNNVAVVAGDTITVKVYFTSLVCDTNVFVKAELQGSKVDTETITPLFDVETNQSYKEVLTLQVPFDLNDKRSDDYTLSLKIDGDKYKTVLPDITIRVQRPSYAAVIESISTSQTIEAGKTIPVDLVLKNLGYNDLNDLYVTASIPALGIEKSGYFGDIVALEGCDDKTCTTDNCPYTICDEDSKDTVSGRLYLEVPYSAKAGVYDLQVDVKNSDTTSTQTKQVTITNAFSSGNIIVSSTSQTVSAGENAVYSLLIVNPTDQVIVYRIVPESSGTLSSTADQAIVAVPAGSSQTVKITASSQTAGDYNFNVNVFSGNDLVDTIALNAKVTGVASTSQLTSPVVIVTVILAIIFLVLLIVLIVLLGKKPSKSEEFGESYY